MTRRILNMCLVLAAIVTATWMLYKATRISDRWRAPPKTSKPTPDISAKRATEWSRTPEPSGKPVRVLVAPVISPERSLPSYQLLVNYLSRALKRPARLMLRSSYAEVNAMVRHRQCDIAFVCTYAYVEGNRDFGMRAIAVPVVGGKSTYQSYVVVRRDHRASTLLELKGSRFVGADVLSNTGWLYPASWLKKRGRAPSRFFKSLKFIGSHDRALFAVVKGLADVAAVDSLVYNWVLSRNPKLASRIRVIQKSESYGMPPVVAHPALDPRLRTRITEALIHMHETPNGRRALRKLNIDRFTRPRLSDYNSVRAMAGFAKGRTTQ